MYNILNLGCGKRRIEGAINIDIDPDSLADVQMNAEHTPWIWNDYSINEIYMFHFLEHTKEPNKILAECFRVLVKGGILHITVPHSSCAGANGCLFHHRTFSYNSLKDFLKGRFETIHQRIVWLPHYEWLPIQWLIDLSPRFFERIWCYYVGGATEVQWEGEKIYSKIEHLRFHYPKK